MEYKPDSRKQWIKMRVTADEKATIQNKAASQQQTLTDFIRQRCLHYRLRQTSLEKQAIRQLAAIGSNLNQIARWANTYKSQADALRILACLEDIAQELKALSSSVNDDHEDKT